MKHISSAILLLAGLARLASAAEVIGEGLDRPFASAGADGWSGVSILETAIIDSSTDPDGDGEGRENDVAEQLRAHRRVERARVSEVGCISGGRVRPVKAWTMEARRDPRENGPRRSAAAHGAEPASRGGFLRVATDLTGNVENFTHTSQRIYASCTRSPSGS